MKILLLVVLLLALVAPCFAQAPVQTQAAGNLQLRLIFMKYADPADIAFLFGGSVIQGGGMYGGGGNSGGGYGGGSGYGGNSGYGGSSRGGNSSYGGGSRSSRGGNRGY